MRQELLTFADSELSTEHLHIYYFTVMICHVGRAGWTSGYDHGFSPYKMTECPKSSKTLIFIFAVWGIGGGGCGARFYVNYCRVLYLLYISSSSLHHHLNPNEWEMTFLL